MNKITKDQLNSITVTVNGLIDPIINAVGNILSIE